MSVPDLCLIEKERGLKIELMALVSEGVFLIPWMKQAALWTLP